MKKTDSNGLRVDELIEMLTDHACDRVTESLDSVARGIERRIIPRVLGKTGGNRTKAANLLGIKHTTLSYKMKKMSISPLPRSLRTFFADECHNEMR